MDYYEYTAGTVEGTRELANWLNQLSLAGWEPFMLEQQFARHGGMRLGWLVILRRVGKLDELKQGHDQP